MVVDKQHEYDFASQINDHVASLRYAGMIQKALMPDTEILTGQLKDFFVLFRPRDIVSGDFYHVFSNRQKICISVGDCTGHGVPGALMSILGISFLNEIMQSGINLRANRILNMMREKVMKALNQKGEGGETKESIDIALCIVDRISGKLQYSGANRPLLMIRNGELKEFKPDKMTIGVAPLIETSFTTHSIDTKVGDTFYMFSDGFADQFSGRTDKKYKYKRFRELLASLGGFPLKKQKESLEEEFLTWKSDAEQIDDVLVFGFQL